MYYFIHLEINSVWYCAADIKNNMNTELFDRHRNWSGIGKDV